MKKLEVTLNKESKNNWEALNISYSENEKDIDGKTREVLRKINNDEIVDTFGTLEHIISNFSQEEVTILASLYFSNKFRSIQKKAIKSDKNKKKKALKALDKLSEIARILGKKATISNIENKSADKDEFLNSLKRDISKTGVELNLEPLL